MEIDGWPTGLAGRASRGWPGGPGKTLGMVGQTMPADRRWGGRTGLAGRSRPTIRRRRPPQPPRPATKSPSRSRPSASSSRPAA